MVGSGSRQASRAASTQFAFCSSLLVRRAAPLMRPIKAVIAFWWVEYALAPTRLGRFPSDCHKFIVFREERGRAHVVASDDRLDQHADIAAALQGWHSIHPDAEGPWGRIAGGGHGGEQFPGWSQAFGPPPDDVIAAITGGGRSDSAESVPASLVDALLETGCRSLEELTSHVETSVSLSLLSDQLEQVVEVEHWAPGGEMVTARLSVARLEGLLTSGGKG